MSVAAAVLAAGAGSRFHGESNKLLAYFRGRPLVLWAVEAALGAGLDEVAVVAGAAHIADLLPPDVVVVLNERWGSGQASSLRAAVDWCGTRGHSAVVVGLADQPLVPSAAWRAVAGARQAPIVAASYNGSRRNPVRLDRSVWPLLPSQGDEGARALMRQRPELVAEVECEGDPADVDTLADLEQLNRSEHPQEDETWS
jgi:molybdenum cofactor cytidylyltransferase